MLRRKFYDEGDASGSEAELPPDEPALESPPEPEPEPESEPEPSPLLGIVNELGFSNVDDEDQARQRLVEGWQAQQRQFEELRERYQAAQPFIQAGQQYLQSRPEPEPEPQQSQDWWAPPQFDPRWIERYRTVKQDEQGNQVVTWAENTPQTVKENSEAYQAYIEEWSNKLIHNPKEAFRPFQEQILSEVRDLLKQDITQHTSERDTQEFFSQVQRDNADWLYAKDPVSGDVARNPVTTEPVLSTEGQQALSFLDQAEAMGIKDPRDQWKYTMDQIALLRARSSQPGNTQGQRVQHLRRAAQSDMSRTGSIQPPDSALPQNANLTPGRQLLAQLEADGQLTRS